MCVFVCECVYVCVCVQVLEELANSVQDAAEVQGVFNCVFVYVRASMLQHVATCCTVLPCVATCSRVLYSPNLSISCTRFSASRAGFLATY